MDELESVLMQEKIEFPKEDGTGWAHLYIAYDMNGNLIDSDFCCSENFLDFFSDEE